MKLVVSLKEFLFWAPLSYEIVGAVVARIVALFTPDEVNAASPIVLIVAGSRISVRLLQFSKACEPIVVSAGGNDTFVRAEHCLNVISGIVVSLEHMLMSTVLSDVHCSNTPVTPDPRDVRDEDKEILVRALH